MLAAVLAIVAFVSMFIAKQVVHSEWSELFYDFRYGAFFGDDSCKGNVLGFIGYLFILLGGLAGLAFVFVDEMIGKDLTNKLSFVAGILAVLGALLIFLFAPIFKAMNGSGANNVHTTAAPIVFGVFALLVGGVNIAAPFLEKKGL